MKNPLKRRKGIRPLEDGSYAVFVTDGIQTHIRMSSSETVVKSRLVNAQASWDPLPHYLDAGRYGIFLGYIGDPDDDEKVELLDEVLGAVGRTPSSRIHVPRP